MEGVNLLGKPQIMPYGPLKIHHGTRYILVLVWILMTAKALGYREPLDYCYRVSGTECKMGWKVSWLVLQIMLPPSRETCNRGSSAQPYNSESNLVDVDVQELEAVEELDDKLVDSDYQEPQLDGYNKDVHSQIGIEEPESDGYNSEKLTSLFENSSGDEEPYLMRRNRRKKKRPKFKQYRRETDV